MRLLFFTLLLSSLLARNIYCETLYYDFPNELTETSKITDSPSHIYKFPHIKHKNAFHAFWLPGVTLDIDPTHKETSGNLRFYNRKMRSYLRGFASLRIEDTSYSSALARIRLANKRLELSLRRTKLLS